MTPEELQSAIVLTKQNIEVLKQQIEEAVDFKAKRRLSRQLKELQYLQFWHLEHWRHSIKTSLHDVTQLQKARRSAP